MRQSSDCDSQGNISESDDVLLLNLLLSVNRKDEEEMQKPLPPDAQALLSAHAAAGRAALQKGDLVAAEASFLEAWRAIPEPRIEYDHAQSLSRGLVKFYRDTGQFEKAAAWVQTTREAYGGGYNDLVEFLAATVHFEAGALDEAFSAFDELYRLYKRRPFQGEDKRYLEFYLQRAKRSGKR